ncbi:T9SS type A sorting domain-containing protein [Hymenobacter sp. B81]|uniref:T9SS type A sorting domain-containing protein n=1 Tax=Hymenobacter sp. B81 TaxID=3344878 RepID=UPI0037DD4135
MKTSSWLKTLALSCALLPVAPAFSAFLGQEPAAFEQGGPGKHRGGKGHKGNPEMRAYRQQNVLPVVRQQRQKLDAQLSAADKTQLEGYRAQLKALREKNQAFRQSLRPAAGSARPEKGQRPALTDAQKQQLQQLRTEQRAIMQNVQQLASKYEATIQQLAAEVQPQRDQWTADLKALREKSLTPEQKQKMQQRQQLAGKDGKGRKDGKGPGGQNYFAPARFLLMSPTAPLKKERTERGGRAALYPNPAGATQRLEYEVKKEGSVKVELQDERGKTLRTLLDAKQAKGPQTLEVNLSDLPRGTYYYKITGKNLSETRRFVKE